MKALFINGSPRKNGNTAQLLKRAMEGASEAHKAEVRDTQFPVDLEKAYELGRRLVELSKTDCSSEA